jgi:hypothetical protein
MPLTAMSTEAKLDWCIEHIKRLTQASHADDPNKVADGFTVTNLTENRSLNVATATTAQVAQVLGTLLDDLHKRGAKRG